MQIFVVANIKNAAQHIRIIIVLLLTKIKTTRNIFVTWNKMNVNLIKINKYKYLKLYIKNPYSKTKCITFV